MRLIDVRFSGIARGVGTAKILGRVHSAPLKVADLHLPCAFTIMEVSANSLLLLFSGLNHSQGRDVDLLFGLDMLKAHQACIDLERDLLRIKGRTVAFLPEHELPDQARTDHSSTETTSAEHNPTASTPTPQQPPARFPGTGNSVGGGQAQQPPPRSQGGSGGGAPQQQPRSRYAEKDIQIIMGMGVSREMAIQTLDAAGGNVDLAASLLF